MVRAGIEKSKNKISEIVLAGGSAMIPKIQSLVKDYFNGREPNIRVKPDEVIALGASVHVHSLYISDFITFTAEVFVSLCHIYT